MPLIRDYRPDEAHVLRRCVVELQEFERTIDPRLRPGETMADAYCEQMHERCRRSGGQIFVAEVDGAVVGFVTVIAREPFTELDEPPGHLRPHQRSCRAAAASEAGNWPRASRTSRDLRAFGRRT